MEKWKHIESVDRLSELPDSLILEILSWLGMRDAVGTTLLSKRWKNLWTTIPCIDFTDEHPKKFIRAALSQWKGAKILKCSLTCGCNIIGTCYDSVVDSCLLFAIEKQVEELSIDYSRWFMEYLAPQSLYSSSSITELSLSHCLLDIEGNVQWNQLKSLTIEHRDSLSAEAMSKILLGAPRLEELILGIHEISGNFNIRSPSLKMLQLGKHDDRFYAQTLLKVGVLRIWAPNLSTLQISTCFYDGGSCYLDVPSLTNAYLYLEYVGDVTTKFELMLNQVFQSLCHVEKVTLCEGCIQLLLDMKKKDMVMSSSNAKFLLLYDLYYGTKHILHLVEMMFPKLERLILGRGYTGKESEWIDVAMVNAYNSLESKISFPNPPLLHLKTIEITSSIRDTSIIPVIEFLLENARILEKMVIQLRCLGANSEMFILAEEKVLSMPRSSLIAQVIISQL